MKPPAATAETPAAPVPSRTRKDRAVVVEIHVEPGKVEKVRLPAAALSRWGICRLRLDGGTRIVQDFKTYTGWYRLTEKPERDLGLPFHWQWYIVMGYLGKFFKVTRPSPAVTLVEIHSLLEHLEAAEDEGFWTPERVERWQTARRDYNGATHTVRVPRRKGDARPVEAQAAVKRRVPLPVPGQLELFE